MALPRFFIADLNGANQVILEGEEMPNPPPTPYKASRGSDHTTLAGDTSPGGTLRQDFGAEPYGLLEVRCKKILAATRTALLTKYEAWADGERPRVQCGYVGGSTWYGTWVDLRTERRMRNLRWLESYTLEATLRLGPAPS